MRRNIMAKVTRSEWVGPEPTTKRPSLRVGDRVSLRACQMGLIVALNTHPVEPKTPYDGYVGYWYTVQTLDGPEVGLVLNVPAPLIGRVFTRRGRIDV